MFSYCSEANITGTLIDIVITGEVTRTYKPDGTSIGDKDAFVAHDSSIAVTDAFRHGVLFAYRRLYLSFPHHRTCRSKDIL